MDPGIRSAILTYLAVHKGALIPIGQIAQGVRLSEDHAKAHIHVLEQEGLVEYPSGMGAGTDRVRITARGAVEAATNVARRFVDGEGGEMITAARPCPPVIPGTYHGSITIDGQPAPNGTLVVALVDGMEWSRTETLGGRYVMDIPQQPPTHPPCFEGGPMQFRCGLSTVEGPFWESGLHYFDLFFQGASTPLTVRDRQASGERAGAKATPGSPPARQTAISRRATESTVATGPAVSIGETEKQYFVAHEFTPEKTDDLRRAIDEALADSGLTPYYADNEVRQGHILTEKIVPKIRSTRFGIFDLSNPDKPNVFLELGAAIGMGKPYLIICERGTKLPSDVLGLDRIEYESYVDLTRQLKAKVSKALRGDP